MVVLGITRVRVSDEEKLERRKSKQARQVALWHGRSDY